MYPAMDARLLSALIFAVCYVWPSTIAHDDPEIHYDSLKLISSKGYPAELHNATTSDGYILGLHRIPYGRKENSTVNNSTGRPVVFLQHGILGASSDWLVNLENESFAYLLADAGFDVWMGNVRGNTYSRHHVSLSPNDKRFWEFSFDQHALLDLPAMLETALRVSGQQQLHYIGHSQGTIMSFINFLDPAQAKLIKKMYALAPVVYIKHVEGVLAYIAPHYKLLQDLLDVVGHGEFLPSKTLMDRLSVLFCTVAERTDLCSDFLFLACGYDQANLNETRIPVYASHSPAGTSVRNLAHWAQLILSGKFAKYDYGSAGANMKVYGQATPPDYNVTKLTVPTTLYYGGHDWIADPTDVSRLIPMIKNVLEAAHEIKPYEHLDFIFGLNARQVLYDEIINDMRKMEMML